MGGGNGTFGFPQLTNQPHAAGLLSLDITKTCKVLGWQPRLNARQALEMTLEWYKRFYQAGATSIEELMGEHVDAFFSAITKKVVTKKCEIMNNSK